MDEILVALAILSVSTTLICLYFVPSFIAAKKPQWESVFVCNLLVGWTFLGWLVALVWALSGDRRPEYRKDMKRCHGCGEYVLHAATVCRYCRTSFYHTLAEDQSSIPTLMEVI